MSHDSVPPFSLADIIPGIPKATIVDIGAMLLDGDQLFCRRLVENQMARIIAFEPDQAECTKVNRALGPPHECLPFFVADGTERIFYQTNMAMTGSLYRPNRAVVDRYNHLGESMQVVATHRVTTVRLDDVVAERDVDLLKMDVQGAELDVLLGAQKTLETATIVQAEVSFVEMYERQCLFADVDRLLRAQGFAFHTLRGIAGRTLKPMVIAEDLNRPLNQFLWSDAVYLRDLNQIDRVPTEKLTRMALLLHDEYGSFDFCHFVLGEFDRRAGTAHCAAYEASLAGLHPT